MEESQRRRSPTARGAAPGSDGKRPSRLRIRPRGSIPAPPDATYARVELFSGSRTFWTAEAGATAHAVALENLIQFLTALPGVRLGIDPQGIAQIVRSV